LRVDEKLRSRGRKIDQGIKRKIDQGIKRMGGKGKRQRKEEED